MAETLQDILQTWGDEQIAQAVLLLNQSNVTTSGALANSLRAEVVESLEGISLKIYEADYGQFVRQGVQGAKESFKAPNSPFKFRDKMPPPGPIDRWVVKKGLTGTRNAQGQFVSRKSLTFAIQRSIFNFGISPFNYLSPFFKNINELQGVISENQKREILLLLESTLNERTK